MRVTNKKNLPAPIYEAAKNSVRPPKPRELHVTQLIQPAQLEALRRLYWDDLEEDCSDLIWAILGTAVHSIFESASDLRGTEVREQYLHLPLSDDGWDLVGTADRWKDGIITDYKMTSAYKIQKKSYDDWEKQLNVYAHLFRAHGHDVHGLQVAALIRDWKKREFHAKSDYPAQSENIPIPLWSPSEAADYVQRKYEEHRQAQEAGEWDDCTPDERWGRDEVWAIHKLNRNGSVQKRAIPHGLHTNEQEAEMHRETLESISSIKYTVVHRPPHYVRCYDHWCPVAALCPQLRKEKNE